jgi:ABC-type maltose transport system permease subunit
MCFAKIVRQPLRETNSKWDRVIEKATQKDALIRHFDLKSDAKEEKAPEVVLVIEEEKSNIHQFGNSLILSILTTIFIIVLTVVITFIFSNISLF